MPAMPTLAVLRGARRSKLLVGAAVVVLVIFGLTLAPLLAMDGLPPPEPFVHRIVRPGAPAKHGPGQPPRRVANASSLLPELPPDFPPPESLRHPSKFEHFTEAPRSQTPVVNAFPAKLLGAIRPDEWTGRAAPASGKWDPPRGTFAREWVAPEWVSFGPDKPKANDLPRIQFDFPPEAERDADRRQLVAARREVVRNAFLHAWEGYKKHAWGSDEIKPVTGKRSDPFLGWGATIVDSLDTLLLMQLPDEYMLAREHVRDIDWGVISGIDWGRGPAQLGRTGASIHAFETVIRYLGGLLGAYDLSGDPLLLTRAEELGQIILPVFDTSSGVPLSRINPKDPKHNYAGHAIQLAEAGTLALEYTRLSQLTGNRTYFDLAQRGMDYLDQVLAPKSPFPPLLPTMFSTETWKGGTLGTYSFGGMADSAVEYLIKQHVLLRGSLPRYAQLYSQSIDRANAILFKEPKVPGKNLLTVGEVKGGRYQYAMEHLSCFTGAMLGLGAQVLDYRKKDLFNAKRITQTCYYIGSATESGLQPERVDFYAPENAARFEHVMDDDTEEVFDIPRGRPVGVKSQHKHYISRPESLESVFYMYRITGDERYQDQGWRMFTDWVDQTRTEWGFGSVKDVGRRNPLLSDNMESFVLAETFKYYYLLQADPSELSLDTYVLNTEAHPFIHSPAHKPGDAGLFDLSLLPKGDAERPVGEGTDAQKWAVYRNMVQLGMIQTDGDKKAPETKES